MLIALEGLDQAGKETQGQLLRDALRADGRRARLESFPDYGTSIGEEIARALQGERDYGPDVMQLLYVANRHERRADLLRWLEAGIIVVCDRYVASSVAYGEAQDLDVEWLTAMQRFLPPPDVTVLLDIAPEVDRETVQLLVDHEVALKEFAEQELAGEATSLDPVRAVIARARSAA